MRASLLAAFWLFSGTAQALEVVVLGQDRAPMPGAVITLVGDHFAAPDLAEQAVIDQQGRRFEPFVSLVAPGAEVSFPNSDDTRHHVYSFSEGNAFELKLYRSDDAPPVVFENTGVVTLGCNIHDNMKAYVVVSGETSRTVADKSGRAQMPWVPAGDAVTLSVWHPALEDPMTFDLDAQATSSGEVALTLPVSWDDPQAVRSVSELESLLKRYSRDAR